MNNSVKNNNFSIIIPVYNKERYLERAVNSIVRQEYPTYEIVIVDDGSTDGSMNILSQFERYPIRIFTQINKGPASARNLGVSNARYEWCMFLDADDVLLPKSLVSFNDLINTYEDFNVFVGNYYISNNENRRVCSLRCTSGEVKGNFYSFFKNKLPMRAGSFVCKKTVLEQFPQREDLHRYEDMEALLNILRHEKIYCSPTPVMVYNVGCATASQRRKDIKEDFLGNISFTGKSFWERAILWSLYEQALKIYPNEINQQNISTFKKTFDVRLYFYCARKALKFRSFLGKKE